MPEETKEHDCQVYGTADMPQKFYWSCSCAESSEAVDTQEEAQEGADKHAGSG